jgi:hypothetical protein
MASACSPDALPAIAVGTWGNKNANNNADPS